MFRPETNTTPEEREAFRRRGGRIKQCPTKKAKGAVSFTRPGGKRGTGPGRAPEMMLEEAPPYKKKRRS
jgi:hypothetical protein